MGRGDTDDSLFTSVAMQAVRLYLEGSFVVPNTCMYANRSILQAVGTLHAALALELMYELSMAYMTSQSLWSMAPPNQPLRVLGVPKVISMVGINLYVPTTYGMST